MKKMTLAAMGFLMISSVSHAEFSTCVVDAGIGHDDDSGNFNYMTGVGPSGAEPNPIISLNEKVTATLSAAAKSNSTNKQVCMKGSLLQISKGNVQFLVYSAVEKTMAQ